jgi:acetyltransferase
MTVRHLHFFFAPRSIAVIGASRRAGSVGATVFSNLLAGGFAGPVWPVNPKYANLGGQTAYASVARLPAVPELAVICTPAATVPGLIAQLGDCGCRAAVVLSAGLDAAPNGGPGLRQQMLEAAGRNGLRILGPNCLGLLVPGIGMNASFAPAAARPGRLAFVAQSGALVTAVLDWAAERRIGFSSFVSVGDGSDVDVGDLLDYLAGDPGTQAILLYVESLRQARKFMSAARRAARAKPTLVVKAGRVPEAAQAAFSHTGALAGSDLVYDAALRRAGLLRVPDTAALFDMAAILAQPRRPAGPRLAILTNGGGPGVMATDALMDGGGALAALGPATTAALAQVLPAAWSGANPVDIIGDAPALRYDAALQLLLAAPEADAVLFIHAPTALVPSADIARLLLPRLLATPRLVLCCWLGGESVAAARRLCIEAGLPVFDTPEGAVQAFLQLVQYQRNQQLLLEAPPVRSLPPPQEAAARERIAALLAAGVQQAGEADTKAVLAAYGIPVVGTERVQDAAGALEAASRIGYPVALKVVSPDIVHKSDAGGVVLDIQDAAALQAAVDAMRRRLAQQLPQARLAGFTVQAMARRPGAWELIVGVSCDPVFGPVVLFGQGGVAVEVLADQAIGLPPLNRVLAAELVSRTRVARLLAGFRDRPAVDMAALQEVLVRVGQMACDLGELVELDINPLLADAHGVLALDARMRLTPAPPGGARERLAILPYPRHLERELVWQGQALTLRPIRPDDAAAHQAFFAALSPEDVHARWFGALTALTPADLARLTQIDYAREMAFIATRGTAEGGAETLGVARVVADPDGRSGEFAIVVRSALKGQGLGRLLMDCLLDYCRSAGLAEVVGCTLADNARMAALARACGFTVRREEGAQLELHLRLREDEPCAS